MDFTENKGLLAALVAVLALFAVAVFFYNRTLDELAAGSCTDLAAENCPHEKVVQTQNIIISALVLAIGLTIAWILLRERKSSSARLPSQQPGASSPAPDSAPSAPATVPALPASRKVNLSELDSDEKKVIALLQERQGSVFQSEVIKLTGFSKVKVSRMLDRMEHNGLVERKRRGMANLIVLR